MITFINYIVFCGDMTRSYNLASMVKVQKNGLYGVKATIPKEVVEKMGISPGDLLEVDVVGPREFIFRKVDGVEVEA